jgi:hypothetical protein
MESKRFVVPGFDCSYDTLVQRRQNGHTERPCATNQLGHIELDVNSAATDSDAKSGKESIPKFVAYGRVYIDRDDVGHVGLYVSKEDASLWFQYHVRIACWVWSAEVELKLVAGKENG